MTTEMSDLQAWLTGIVTGYLMREAATHELLDITVDVLHDEHGNFTNQIKVIGNQSGDVVIITIGEQE